MKRLEYVIKSIINNCTRSVVVFSIMFFLGMIICCSFIIQKTSENVRDQFMSKAGAKVYVTYKLEDDVTDHINWSKEQRSHQETFDYYYGNLSKYAEDPRVKSSSFSIYKYVYSISKDDKQHVSDDEHYRYHFLFGVDRPVFKDLREYDINMLEGRTFTDEEIVQGAYVCIINEEYNDGSVKVGDKVTLSVLGIKDRATYNIVNESNVFAKDDISLKVIGVFHSNNASTTKGLKAQLKVYVPKTVVEECQRINDIQYDNYGKSYIGEEAYNHTSLAITDIEFELNDLKDITSFGLDISNSLWDLNHGINNIGPDGLPKEEYLRVIRSTEIYDMVGWVIKALSAFSKGVVIVSIISFSVVMALTVFMILKKKTVEIGILMSLGLKRSEIIYRTVLEFILISLFAFVGAMAASYVVSKPVSNKLIQDTLVKESTTYTTDDNGSDIVKYCDMNQQDVIDMFNITVSVKNVAEIFIIEITALLVSLLLPMVFIVRLKPKKVLLGGE